MKAIKNILRKVDVFSVPLSFSYKNEDKYSTSFGGFIFILFIAVVLVVGIYYFIPFAARKNYTLVYYSMKLPTAERIKLKESKAAFALGFDCRTASDGTKAEDILDLQLNYLIYKKYSNGTRKKFPEPLSSHKCTYADFYNQYNATYDLLNLKTFECLDNTEHVIEGIYTDEIFSYYEFSILTKKDTKENFDRIDKYLTENDCKLVVYYTDITFDLDNYKDPIKPFLNEVFMQLNPTLYLKMNAYFMNQYFSDDDYLIFNFDETKPITKTLYSREETYSLYKGLDRSSSKPTDYKYYIKMYIRADTKKTEVKRKYQKFMEFYADASSLLIALFELLFVILTFINNFYAKYSISKKIFLFKEVESHHFDFSLNHHKIKKLIALTDPYKDILPNTTTPNANKNVNLAKEENIKALEKEEIKIVNININDEVEKGQEEKQLERKKIILRTSRKNSKKLTFANKEHTELQTVRSLKNEIMSVDRFNSKPVFISSRVEDFIIDSPEYQNKIKYTFNVFEIIAHYCFFCCLTKNMKLKRELNLKANSILNYKLDIILYTRNMILLDIMNKLLLDQDKKSIINFLTRPTLYSKKEVETEYDKFYNNYSGKDFNNLSEEISNLAEKSDKLMTEKKLISLSNKILKELI